MFHFIRFAAGVLTGMAAMALIKSKKTKAGLEKAEDKLRGAAASTLRTVEKASAKAREHLAPEAEETTEETEAKEAKASSRRRASSATKREKGEKEKE